MGRMGGRVACSLISLGSQVFWTPLPGTGKTEVRDQSPGICLMSCGRGHAGRGSQKWPRLTEGDTASEGSPIGQRASFVFQISKNSAGILYTQFRWQWWWRDTCSCNVSWHHKFALHLNITAWECIPSQHSLFLSVWFPVQFVCLLRGAVMQSTSFTASNLATVAT